jgi:hypothetical protein
MMQARTVCQRLQPPARGLCWPMDHINRMYQAWHLTLRLGEGTQRRDAEVVCTTEQDPQWACHASRRWAGAVSAGCRACDRDRQPPKHAARLAVTVKFQGSTQRECDAVRIETHRDLRSRCGGLNARQHRHMLAVWRHARVQIGTASYCAHVYKEMTPPERCWFPERQRPTARTTSALWHV